MFDRWWQVPARAGLILGLAANVTSIYLDAQDVSGWSTWVLMLSGTLVLVVSMGHIIWSQHREIVGFETSPGPQLVWRWSSDWKPTAHSYIRREGMPKDGRIQHESAYLTLSVRNEPKVRVAESRASRVRAVIRYRKPGEPHLRELGENDGRWRKPDQHYRMTPANEEWQTEVELHENGASYLLDLARVDRGEWSDLTGLVYPYAFDEYGAKAALIDSDRVIIHVHLKGENIDEERILEAIVTPREPFGLIQLKALDGLGEIRHTSTPARADWLPEASN